MKAVVYQGPHHMKVIEKPKPRIEHPDDIIVRVTRTAICG
jgi:alcohol dehydrogenase